MAIPPFEGPAIRPNMLGLIIQGGWDEHKKRSCCIILLVEICYNTGRINWKKERKMAKESWNGGFLGNAANRLRKMVSGVKEEETKDLALYTESVPPQPGEAAVKVITVDTEKKPAKGRNRVSGRRDYKRESKWEKGKYRQFSVKVNREFGEAFAAKLAADGVTLADWFRENVRRYVGE